jgi:nucleoid-associated protein YgaU
MSPSESIRRINSIGGGLLDDPTTRPTGDDRVADQSNGSFETNGASAPISTTNADARQREHVIRPGETLTAISQMAYGNPNLYPAILRANPNLDPKRMRPGTTIILPALSEIRPDAQPAGATIGGSDSAALDSKSEYRTQSNDSLYRISMKLYGTPAMVDKLYELNKSTIGSDPAKLKLGMVLKLPEPPTQSAAR